MSIPTAPLRQSWLIAGRGLRHWQREPWTPLFGIVFTIMLLLVFGYVFGGAMEVPGDGDYREFLLPGMFALSMTFGLKATMSAIANDSKKGVTNRFRSLPISSLAIPLGRSGDDMVNSALELCVLMLGGLAVGWRTGAGMADIALAVALLLWLRFALLWLGILLGLTLRGEGAVSGVQILIWPVGFLSNAIVATETMPGWLGAIAEWNPISATAAACRELFGNPSGSTGGLLDDHAVTVAALWPLVLALVFIPLSARAFRRLSN